MKYIYLLRHAKAANGGPQSNDHERPLTEGGKHSAAAIGAYMRQKNLMPELTLCSDAQRTRETLEYCQQGMQYDLPVDYIPKLYLASPAILFSFIQRQSNDLNQLMIVGHNPGIHQLALELAVHDASSYWEEISLSFPTASLAVISCHTESWELISPRSGRLEHFVSREHIPEPTLSA